MPKSFKPVHRQAPCRLDGRCEIDIWLITVARQTRQISNYLLHRVYFLPRCSVTFCNLLLHVASCTYVRLYSVTQSCQICVITSSRGVDCVPNPRGRSVLRRNRKKMGTFTLVPFHRATSIPYMVAPSRIGSFFVD